MCSTLKQIKRWLSSLMMNQNKPENFMLKKLLIIILFFSMNVITIPCTTAVISGKATPDGRPLLMKHRDSGFLQNKIMYFEDGKYKYTGLVNAEDSAGKEVWSGFNETGFAIMNSASYNLNTEEIEFRDQEGVVMKMALQKCRDLKDFENLLDTLSRPMGVEANFGVIDAEGGAAYYETHNYGYTKIDANDPLIAPEGYIIRSNYSGTGTPGEGYGYIRYMTASELFYEAYGANQLDYKFLLQKVSRSLKHSLLDADLAETAESLSEDSHFVHFSDYIPRFYSCGTTVVQGIKNGENPGLTVMWTILGFPLTSVVAPVFLTPENILPKTLIPAENGFAPLADYSLKLKDRCYPVKRGSGENYLNLSALINKEGDGFMQKLRPLENDLMKISEHYISDWREKGKPDNDEMNTMYRKIDNAIFENYKRFGL